MGELQTDFDQLFEPGDCIGVQVPQELRNRLDGPPPFTLSCARFVFEIEEVMKPNP
jgi:hypothetical protein